MKPRSLTYAEIQERIAAIENDPDAASATILGQNSELRAALESRRGETYTDFEWDEATRNLAKLIMIGIDWKRDRDDRERRR